MKILEIALPVEQHDRLNPVIWADHQLKPEVKSVLLRVAKDFKDYVGIPFKVVDVRITGGNANFTYTPHSDIDLHLIADYDSVDCDRTAEELFDSKRLLYKKDYDIKVHGIPVELYVENLDHPAVTAGEYSLLKNQWLRQPTPNIPDYNKSAVEAKVKMWHKLIKRAMNTGDLSACRSVMKLVRSYRKEGLKTPEGEFSVPNLVYKSLRNDHTVLGLQTLIDQLHSRDLSLSY